MIVRLALVASMAAACIEPHLTDCPGYECPGGTVCDLAHQSCVDQSQLDECAGKPDLTPCVAKTVSGLCFDMVCLEPGCGNRVVEAGEECDDGNHISGDGCSLDCTSTEKCGNGVLDVAFGEGCDDGNLANHDGCNSQCQSEQPVYSLTTVRIMNPDPKLFAYDVARDRLVFAGQFSTWEWDGTEWRIVEVQRGVVDTLTMITYDPQRDRVVGFGTISGKLVFATWDGTTWSAFDVAGTAIPPQPLAVTYYPLTDSLAVITPTQLVFFDLATNTFKASIPIPFNATAPAMAFDKARAVLTVVEPSAGATWDYGPDWVAHPSMPPGASGWSLIFDTSRNHVVAVGGVDPGTMPLYYDDVSIYDPAQKWVPLPAVVSRAARQTLWQDRSTGDIMVFAGFDDRGELDTMYRLKGGAEAMRVPLVQPNTPGPLVYDSVRRQLVLVTVKGDTWTHGDTGWNQITPNGPKPPPTVGPLVFDPVRAVGLAIDATTNLTWQWDPSMWKASSFATGVTLSPTVTTYDYDQRAFVSITPSQASALPSSDTNWTNYGEGIMASSAAYDLGNHNVVVLGTVGGGLADLGANGWQPSLSPGPGYVVASWFARKSIVMVPSSAVAPVMKQIWERRGSTFQPLGAMPVRLFTLDGVSDGEGGELVFAVHDGHAAFLIHMQLRSGLPDETCRAGEDADGDHLSACDDPDCWESCWPACPYAASCP